MRRWPPRCARPVAIPDWPRRAVRQRPRQGEQQQLSRGKRLVEILKQPQYRPLAVEKQVVLIYAAINGYFDAVEVDTIGGLEQQLHTFFETHHPSVLTEIAEKKLIDDELKGKLNELLKEFMKDVAGVKA